MKRIYICLSVLATLLYLSACRKLDVPVESQYVKSNFPVTTNDYTGLMGSMYSNLASDYAIPYWRMQELTTDEAILPARDGNFDDGGQYRQMHYHIWTKDHPYVSAIWTWGFGGINNCNSLINVVNGSPSTAAAKAASITEIRTMRALY